jgi:RNA polymerase sigma-70 factor (ECF subfamily)
MTTQVEVPWEELYGNLRGFVGRRVSNPADVDDLVQAVMVRLLKGLGTLRNSERLHPWVYRTARNVIIDHYRAVASRREIAATDDDRRDDDVTSQQVADENEDAALQELASCLAPMLRQLDPPYQEAVTLTELAGVTQAEAATRAGISFSGMKSRVQRARKRLRTVLEECCRIQLDRRGGIIAYEPRQPNSCNCRTCSSEPERHKHGRIHGGFVPPSNR